MTPSRGTEDTGMELCHAHSGIVTWMKLGGTILTGLMVIFMALLGFMWSELKGQNKEILAEVRCLAPAEQVKELRDNFLRLRSDHDKLEWEVGGLRSDGRRNQKRPDPPEVLRRHPLEP